MSDVKSGERGQALALGVVAMTAVIAMAGLIVDGGNAWAQQRLVQNTADAAAEAGAVVLVKSFSGQTAPGGNWDTEVQARMAEATRRNLDADGDGVLQASEGSLNGAWYTDLSGNTRLGVVGAGSVPSGAQGTEAEVSRGFATYLARIVGATSFTAGAGATAVAGALHGPCDVDAGCAILPITFPVTASTCDNTGSLNISPGSADWPIVAKEDASDSNMSIVPLCKNNNNGGNPNDIGGASSGSVGWLDMGCPGNLEDWIRDPCPQSFDLDDGGVWLQTKAGNANNVEDAMNSYIGQIVLVPLFDGTCKEEPPGATRESCPENQEGVGANTWYHIPKFAAFLLHRAYIQGNNNPPCNSPPGGPQAIGNGANGCLKGWFTKYIVAGPVGPVGGGSDDAAVYATQLIR